MYLEIRNWRNSLQSQDLKIDFLHLNLHRCGWTLGFVVYSVGYNLLLSLFWSSDCSRFGWWKAFQAGWFLYSFICISPSFFFLALPYFLAQKKVFQAQILLLVSPRPGNNHFFKESWLLIVQIVFRSRDLCTRRDHCY